MFVTRLGPAADWQLSAELNLIAERRLTAPECPLAIVFPSRTVGYGQSLTSTHHIDQPVGKSTNRIGQRS